MKSAVLILLVMVIGHGLILAHSDLQEPAIKKETQGARGSSSPELEEASRLSSSVVALYNEGKYDKALPLAKRALEIREKALGKDDDRVVSAVLNLAEVQLSRHKDADARDLYERALDSYERGSGVENERLAKVLDRLAIVYYRLARAADTESAYQRSLSLREKALGPDHSEVATSIYHLAEFYQFEGQYQKAEPYYQRLVELRKKQGSQELVSEAQERYACLLRKTNRSAEADELEGRMPEKDTSSGAKRAPIPAGIVNGRAIHLEVPQFPYEAKAVRVFGAVSVHVLINESGNVIRACAVSGPRLLMKASESAAYRARFSATTVEGKPVKVTGVIVYNFAP